MQEELKNKKMRLESVQNKSVELKSGRRRLEKLKNKSGVEVGAGGVGEEECGGWRS